MPLIEVEHVTKGFPARRGPRALLGRNGFWQLLKGRSESTFTALDDVSFAIEKGESLGIIGANGSGKSTLLKIIAGVTTPSAGHVRVHGRVASLLELGAGFHPMLTGRENVYLNAGILGMRHAQVDEVFDRIVEFSGIGNFIDNPVDTYSSGMYVRIGFAVAAHVNPDIFLVDEVLAVGDEEFQRKCRKRLGELREEGKTLVFVSHDLGAVGAICDRVLLLDKGRMVVRRTPQETIDYYLRMVGREQSVHSFASGATEAIFNNGRICLFHNKHEVTASYGLQTSVQSMEQRHPSPAADWTILERSPNGCVARGRMLRLPLSFIWRIELRGDTLTCRVEVECERETAVRALDAQLFLPPRYTGWVYGDLAGEYPDIIPSDHTWTPVVSAEQGCVDTAAIPASDSVGSPPVAVAVVPHHPHVALQLVNSDYITGARVIQAGAQFPEADAVLKPGRLDLMTLQIDLGLSGREVREQARQRVERATLRAGALALRFGRGRAQLTTDGVELSRFVHMYSSVLVGNLWHDSTWMRWSSVRREGPVLEATGDSRRLPFRQQWRFEATEEGILLTIWFEALEDLDVQEYQVSIGLDARYSAWRTDHESGAYPPFDPESHDWSHVNKDYAPGTFIEALSCSLPSVRLAVAGGDLPFRMTAINTAYNEDTRVIQALRTALGGCLRFDKGRHLFFNGMISLAPAEWPKQSRK